MNGPVGARTTRVSGDSSGKNGEFKKDGYAKRGPADFAKPTKAGLDHTHGYTGPNVQQGGFDGSKG